MLHSNKRTTRVLCSRTEGPSTRSEAGLFGLRNHWIPGLSPRRREAVRTGPRGCAPASFEAPHGVVLEPRNVPLFRTERQRVRGEAALELGKHLFGLGRPPLPLQLLDSIEPFLRRLLLEAVPHRRRRQVCRQCRWYGKPCSASGPETRQRECPLHIRRRLLR